MTAHILLPQIDQQFPASLSKIIIQNMLRDKLGYKGVIFTDDLCMGAISNQYGIPEAAALSLEAGCDLPLICHDALQYLESYAKMVPDLPGFKEKDRIRRLNKLRKQVHPPLKWNQLELDALISRSHDLIESVGGAQETPPDSPVASY